MTQEITPQLPELLQSARAGVPGAAERVFPVVYEELRAIARQVFLGQSAQHTLQPTALVHEAWLKLKGQLTELEDQRHFYRLAGKAMRQVLADYARAKNADKRGGGNQQVTLDLGLLEAKQEAALDLLDLDNALTKLSQQHARMGEIAELRLFGGLTLQEVSDELGLSLSTIHTDWVFTRAWLIREVRGQA